MNVRVTPNRDLVYLGTAAPANSPIDVTADIAALWRENGWLKTEDKATRVSGAGGKPK